MFVSLNIISEESKNETTDHQNHNIQPHDMEIDVDIGYLLGWCALPRKNLLSNHMQYQSDTARAQIICLPLNTDLIAMSPPL